MIKHINPIKLISFVKEISNPFQVYNSICLIIKVVLNLTPGYIRKLLGLLDKMGVMGRLTVTFPRVKHINTIKLI